jgi:hypothetical protein
VEHHAQVDAFFLNLATPVDKQGVRGVQHTVYKLLGTLCVVYGGFILLLALIPNTPTGRLCFLFCGGVIFAAGLTLRWRGKAHAIAALKTVTTA